MSLQNLYKRYKKDVEFMVIYIKEAHAKEEWWLGETKLLKIGFDLFNSRASTNLVAPKTFNQRIENANQCKINILGDLPTYVDNIKNEVNSAYAALPTRLYLINKDGTVAWDSGKGPFGFSVPDLERAIKKTMGR